MCKCKGGCKRGGIMMYKLKGWMDNGGHYDVQMKGGYKRGIIMCKLKGWMDKEGIMMCKSKGGYKTGHYDVQIKSFDAYLEMMASPLCE